MNTSLTADSRSDKGEDSEKESHLKGTATCTTDKRRKIEAGNMFILPPMHAVKMTERCASSSYSRTLLYILDR